MTVSVDWICSGESLDDGVYAVPGSLIRAADGSRARLSDTGPEQKSAGRLTATSGSRPIMESSCRSLPEGDAAWTQFELLGFVGWLQILGARVEATAVTRFVRAFSNVHGLPAQWVRNHRPRDPRKGDDGTWCASCPCTLGDAGRLLEVVAGVDSL